MATDGVCQMHVELGPFSYIMHESIMRVRGTVMMRVEFLWGSMQYYLTA